MHVPPLMRSCAVPRFTPDCGKHRWKWKPCNNDFLPGIQRLHALLPVGRPVAMVEPAPHTDARTALGWRRGHGAPRGRALPVGLG
ncbi:hypothetical protein FRAHR75_690008 [Frankia sp. Hr75.2]|nr:hypothetical protein FRAHR75_690008 [Frankia sp. Hr75.2]